ncbi:MAG: CZB domain-containing protein [Gallionella sp.]|nr:CZB domain-containing protein [Gallionella sp.]
MDTKAGQLALSDKSGAAKPAGNHFDDAVAAHIKWKIRLTQFIDGTGTEKLDSAIVCQDNQCALGKWIYGDGSKYQHIGHFDELKDRHALFHRCAGEVVKRVDNRDINGARALLSGEFTDASKRTVASIMALKGEVE